MQIEQFNHNRYNWLLVD